MPTSVNTYRIRVSRDTYLEVPVQFLETLKSFELRLMPTPSNGSKVFKLKWDEDGLLTFQGTGENHAALPYLDENGKWLQRVMEPGGLVRVQRIGVDELESAA